jgi:hypothetical protein
MVAKSKKVRDTDAWVERILKHCEIHSDYLHFVNLKSNQLMWFGVSDAKFECQPFVLFRQLKNNNFEKEIKEFEIYTFENLQDKKFKSMLEDSYSAEYDAVEDFRLFFLLDEVEFSIVLTNGNTAKLKQYNDLSEGYELATSLYTIIIDDIEDYTTYCNSDETLKNIIMNLNGYMEINKEKSTADYVAFNSPVVKVKRYGAEVPFEMIKDKTGYSVKLT